MMKRRRVNVGEPLGESASDFERVLDQAEHALGRVEQFGRLAAAFTQPQRRADNPDDVEMVEVAPGVFAPRAQRPYAPGAVGSAQRLVRSFRDLHAEVIGHGRRQRYDR